MATHASVLARPVQPQARTRSGGPRRTRFEQQEHIRTSILATVSMPLDIEAHWTWSNPLNIIPALMLLLFAIGIMGTLFSLM